MPSGFYLGLYRAHLSRVHSFRHAEFTALVSKRRITAIMSSLPLALVLLSLERCHLQRSDIHNSAGQTPTIRDHESRLHRLTAAQPVFLLYLDLIFGRQLKTNQLAALEKVLGHV